MTIRNVTSVVLAILLLGTVSCSKRLDRGVAESQLQAKYASVREYDYIQTGHNPPYGETTHYVRLESGKVRDGKLGALADAGYVSLETIASNVPMNSLFFHGNVDHVVITPTDKAKPYLAGTFGPGSRECNDGCIRFITATPQLVVNGVTEPAEGGGRMMSIVSYQVSWVNTPIGDIVEERVSGSEKKATFVRYDDGWRLEDDDR